MFSRKNFLEIYEIKLPSEEDVDEGLRSYSRKCFRYFNILKVELQHKSRAVSFFQFHIHVMFS